MVERKPKSSMGEEKPDQESLINNQGAVEVLPEGLKDYRYALIRNTIAKGAEAKRPRPPWFVKG